MTESPAILQKCDLFLYVPQNYQILLIFSREQLESADSLLMFADVYLLYQDSNTGDRELYKYLESTLEVQFRTDSVDFSGGELFSLEMISKSRFSTVLYRLRMLSLERG